MFEVSLHLPGGHRMARHRCAAGTRASDPGRLGQGHVAHVRGELQAGRAGGTGRRHHALTRTGSAAARGEFAADQPAGSSTVSSPDGTETSASPKSVSVTSTSGSNIVGSWSYTIRRTMPSPSIQTSNPSVAPTWLATCSTRPAGCGDEPGEVGPGSEPS